MKTIAIIPAHNEEGRIGAIVRGAAEHVDVVAVIDDGSADRTSMEAAAAGAVVLKLPVNIGYGGAIQTGYQYAIRNGYDALVQLDADGQHDPADIPALLEPVTEGRADLALGSRFLKSGSWKPGSPKMLGIRFFSALIRLFTGQEVTDPTTGFQAMNGRLLERVAGGAYPDDFPDADVIVMLLREKYRVEEVGVIMRPPPSGKRMHSGLTPVYYMIKMTLAAFVVMLRRSGPGGE